MSTGVDRRKQHLCAYPFSGMTINPRGQVTLCCAAPNHAVGQLRDIVDLTDFYNGAKMNYYRAEMENGRIASLEPCSYCWKKHSQGHRTEINTANESPQLARAFDLDWMARKEGKRAPIRFLEYTCSNICNQTCSTCNSFFSSKWRELEQRFSSEEMARFDRHINEIQSLSDEDIQKIIKILPDLNWLVVKGGEPWADKNNIYILNELLDVNPQCAVMIVSNMQSISASTFKMLEKIRTNEARDFLLLASIDGIGKVYDWIRGGSFEKTVQNMESYYEVTGRQIDLLPFISIYNYFHLEALIEHFMEKNYVRGICFTNVSTVPRYIRVQNLPKVIFEGRRSALKDSFVYYREQMEKRGKFISYGPAVDDLEPNDPFSANELKLSIEWIEKMNTIRGFRLQDHISELREITEMCRA